MTPANSTESPAESKKGTSSNSKKILAVLLIIVTLAFVVVQVYFSEAGLNTLPGAMSSSFEHNPDQDLGKILFSQRIYAVRTPEVTYAMCPLPKNGCTYHIGLLHRILGEKQYENLGVVHNATKKAAMDITRFPNEEIVEWLADTSIPKYVLIRNPIIRTLSAYINKIESYLDDEEKNAQSFEKWLDVEFPVGGLKEKPNHLIVKINPHWRPQSYYCGFRTTNIYKVFKIFRFEQPKDVVDYLYEIVPRQFLDDGWGKQDNLSLRTFMLGPRKRSGGTESKFLTYFPTLRVFDRLADELEDDINILGYRTEVNELREKVRDFESDHEERGE